MTRGYKWTWEQIKPVEEINMAFGTGFQYQAEAEKDFLAEGDYKARINQVIDNNRLQGAVDVLFSIEGHPNANPYSMTLFSRPEMGQTKKDGTQITDDDLKKWDRQMSRFFDAFGIQSGNFNFIQWKGHQGYVTVKKNKNNEYSSLFVAFNQHHEKTQAPAAVQNVAKAFGGEVLPPAPDATPAGAKTNSFPEDIPF